VEVGHVVVTAAAAYCPWIFGAEGGCGCPARRSVRGVHGRADAPEPALWRSADRYRWGSA